MQSQRPREVLHDICVNGEPAPVKEHIPTIRDKRPMDDEEPVTSAKRSRSELDTLAMGTPNHSRVAWASILNGQPIPGKFIRAKTTPKPKANSHHKPTPKAVPKSEGSESRGGLTGFSCSTLNVHAVDEAISAGTYVIDESKKCNFVKKVRQDDAYAELCEDPRWVRHSTCGKSYKMRSVWDICNWKLHIKKCNGPPQKVKLNSGG